MLKEFKLWSLVAYFATVPLLGWGSVKRLSRINGFNLTQRPNKESPNDDGTLGMWFQCLGSIVIRRCG